MPTDVRCWMFVVRYPTSSIQYPASNIRPSMPTVLLAYYCALILVASIIGGMIPVWFQLTHRWMQFAVSFVAEDARHLACSTCCPTPSSRPPRPPKQQLATLPRLPPEYRSPMPRCHRRSLDHNLAPRRHVGDVLHRAFFSFHHHDVPDDTELEHDHDHHHHDHSHEHEPQAVRLILSAPR